ncbi:MAG TPA: carboxypeptidase regulatory-like domain-containing protein [Gemmatimonadaceae bacterium]|nr:carboxypeptidase regulatory-like domain-containing protein [Gemmatimonadaceae bacterium]
MVGPRLLVLASALATTTLHGQEVLFPGSSGPAVSGIIRDLAGAPIADVEVGVVRGGRLHQFVSTGADGKFLLSGVGAGIVPLRIRRVGYAIQFLDVDSRLPSATTLEIVVRAVANQLEEVTIPAGERRLDGFYERREQRGSFGRFLEQDDIRRLGATNSSDLFRSVPGIVIRSASGGNTIRIRGCQPMVWLDGQRVPGAELDEVVQPSSIAAIEFYPSAAGTPAQYLERENRLCGLVLVWTRTH